MNTRRDFLKKTTLTATGMVIIPEIVNAVVSMQNDGNQQNVKLKAHIEKRLQGTVHMYEDDLSPQASAPYRNELN